MSSPIQQVVEQSKHTPIPPPFSTSGDRPTIWFRRATTWSYDDYDGGLGPYRRAIDIEPRRQDVERTVAPHAIWLLPDIIDWNEPAVQVWILSYLLKPIQTDLGIQYLDRIDQDGAAYPEQIQEAIRTVIDQTSLAGQVANDLGLYWPRSTRGSLDFFFLSLYWLRKFRPERPGLDRLLEEVTTTDLYLIPSNLYEHHPGRKLLSYYDDRELYLKFGRIGHLLFPKEYSSKQQQLDGLVAFGLQQFGYIQVEQWERPVRLRYYPDGTEMSLDRLLSSKQIPRLVLLRLAIQVHASWPWLRDPEVWQPLLTMIDQQSHLIYDEYLTSKRRDYNLSLIEKGEVIALPTLPTPAPSECLVCHVVRADRDFALCGHPICIMCQAMLKSAQCPFCTEHFTAEAIGDDFVELILDGPNPKHNLKQEILKTLEQSRGRLFQFDWANLQVRLFGLKSL